MKPNWLVRKLGEVLRAALSTPEHAREGGAAVRGSRAMLIDTENVAPAHIDEIMTRAGRYGDLTRRLAFGPTTEGKWKEARRKHAIRWARQSQVSAGKNSADIELTITAMDLLCDRSITGFCIVSSDGDFTPIVMRLREAGKVVVGFGEKKAPAGFVEACDRFETIGGEKGTRATRAKAGTKPTAQKSTNGGTGPKQETAPQPSGTPSVNSKGQNGVESRNEFLELVRRAAAKAKHHDGWIHTSVIGSQIRKIKPDVRYKDYGHKTLIGILETFPKEIETRGNKERKQIRLRAQA